MVESDGPTPPRLGRIDFPDTTPPGVLAWEEALLDEVDADGGPGFLWFWEAASPSVVVGYGQSVEREVRTDACVADGIPVYRRCSGGGTVLQGPGCLNYGLVLAWDTGGPLATIAGTNRWVMERHRAAFAAVLDGTVEVCGHTDLVLAGRKFSGNAQRRRRGALLFHGSILHGMDLPAIERYLRMPSSEPAYREGRPHREFVGNLPLAPDAIRAVLTRAWNAGDGQFGLPADRWRDLMEARYTRPEWHAGR